MTENNQQRGQKAQVGYEKLGRGEYELHVLIESTSGLSLDQSGYIDAKIGISALGKTEYTKVKTKLGVEETFWGEHFYITKQFQSAQQAQVQRLQISVYDYNRMSTDTLVGSYQIDLQRIYSQKNHAIEHFWLGLTNMKKSFSQITGYVKISASLLGEKDQNYELAPQQIASVTKERKMLIPPQIERRMYQLIIDVVEGKHIIPADGKTVDSFIKIDYGSTFKQTQPVKKDCFPKYKTRIFLPLSLPASVENISFKLWDSNLIQSDEQLGVFYMNINDIVKSIAENKELKKKGIVQPSVRDHTKELNVNQFRWVNFYGLQLGADKLLRKDNPSNIPSLAPNYVGSVLMRVNIEQSSNPKSSKQSLHEKDIANINKQLPLFYTIVATIGGGLNLYEKNRKYKVSVQVGAEKIQTTYSTAENGFCFWNVKITYVITVSQLQTIPDIFVYLINEKNLKVAYKRYKPIIGVVQQDGWVMMIPDLTIISLQSEQAGLLKLKLQMAMAPRKENVRTQVLNTPIANIYDTNRKSGKLVIDLICGQSLLPLDDDGSIDAFFVFNFMQHEVASTLRYDTLSPIYFQRLIIDTDIPDAKSCPPIIVNAYDKDKLSNQFLGSIFIDINEGIKNGSLIYNPSSQPNPSWYTLTNNKISAGRFLVSFAMFQNNSINICPTIKFDCKKYDVLLVVMGLRGLKSTGALSVKQPFIQFDFGCFHFIDLSQENTTKFQRIIKTEPNEKGRSININSVISAKVNLPENFRYWPSLSAKVRDNVLGDVYQPILGYFSINLQNAYARSQKMKQQFRNRKKTLMNNNERIRQRPPRLKDIDESLLMSLRNFIIKSLNYNWKTVTPDIENNLNSLKRYPNKKLDQDYIVLFPTYEKKPQQTKKALTSKQIEQTKYIQKYRDIMVKNGEYMQIGYDDMRTRGGSANTRNKHYRFTLNEPYESYCQKVNGAGVGLMDEIPIRIGRVFTNKNIISTMTRKITQEDTNAGTYKGQLFINEYNQNQSQQNDQFKKQASNLLNLLIKKGKVHMYLYIIQAANLPPRDLFGHSDPYLVVKAGKQRLQFKKQFFQDEPNPQFLKKVHMILQFPEDSTVDIQVWDYDSVKADELIGTATLDIQNRIQSKLTNARFNNPIQTHNLIRETSKRPQGLIRFWLDLVPVQHHSLYRQFNISNKSKSKFEVRVIIWGVSQMASNDFQDMNDLFVQCNFNGESQQTNVHYRALGGQGSFNWRMIFKVQMPIKNPLITFKVFDKDLFSRNDYICSGSFSIDQYLRQAYETDTSVILYLGTEDLSKYSEVLTGKKRIINGNEFFDRFEIGLVNRPLIGSPSTKLNSKSNGKAQVSIQILTQQQAKRRPAGKGRDNPNQHPYLPQPKNRLQFSLNPLTMVGRLCGPRFKRQLACALVVAVLAGVAIYFAVAFGGSLVGSLVGNGLSN